MPPREWRLRFEDIVEAAEAILDYTRDMGFEAFASDQKTIDAVIRNFEIIGEAARNVPGEIQSEHGTIPWSEMSAMRNILTHEYFGVDISIIWKTVESDIPQLLAHCRSVLELDE